MNNGQRFCRESRIQRIFYFSIVIGFGSLMAIGIRLAGFANMVFAHKI